MNEKIFTKIENFSTDSVENSLGKLSTVIDSMDNQSFDIKHTTFEMNQAINLLNDNIDSFENDNVHENFTDMLTTNKGFTCVVIFIMTVLTIYYFLIYKKDS